MSGWGYVNGFGLAKPCALCPPRFVQWWLLSCNLSNSPWRSQKFSVLPRGLRGSSVVNLHSQRLILDRSEFDYRFVFLGRKVVKEIVDRIHVLFVDKHFIVQVGGGGSSGIADIPDQFATLHVLALAYREIVHVRIPRTVAEAVIDFQHLTVAAELNLHLVDNAISSSVDGRSDGCGEVDTPVHLLHFVDRMEPESVS